MTQGSENDEITKLLTLELEKVVDEQVKEEEKTEPKSEQIQDLLEKPIEELLTQVNPDEFLDQFTANPTILPIIPEPIKPPVNDKKIKEELSFHKISSLELLPKEKAKLVEVETQTDEDFEAKIIADLNPKINSLISARLELLKKKIAEKIYTNVYTALTDNLINLIAKHIESLKEVLKDNIKQINLKIIAKSIDTNKVQNQINVIHKDLQDNVMFILQKIFTASFEQSCQKMTSEVIRVYAEGITLYKQRIEAEENLLSEQRRIDEETTKRNIELIDNLQTIANKQLSSLEKVCNTIKHKAETLLNPPNTEEVKENYPELFNESLATKNLIVAANALTKGQLGANAFIALLSTFEEEKLITLKNENIDHGYIRLMIQKVLMHLNSGNLAITEGILSIVRKMQRLLVPSHENNAENEAIRTMLMPFPKLLETSH